MDADELTLTVTADEGLEVTVDNDTLVVSYGEDTFGSVDVILTAEDETGLTAVDTLNIQIENINDAPVLAALIDTSTAEDIPLVIALSAEDVDGDILTFTAESDNENVDVFVEGTVLTLTPADNYNGTAFITVTVQDNSDLLLTDSEFGE